MTGSQVLCSGLPHCSFGCISHFIIFWRQLTLFYMQYGVLIFGNHSFPDFPLSAIHVPFLMISLQVNYHLNTTVIKNAYLLSYFHSFLLHFFSEKHKASHKRTALNLVLRDVKCAQFL